MLATRWDYFCIRLKFYWKFYRKIWPAFVDTWDVWDHYDRTFTRKRIK
jgi:hypothetical protein